MKSKWFKGKEKNKTRLRKRVIIKINRCIGEKQRSLRNQASFLLFGNYVFLAERHGGNAMRACTLVCSLGVVFLLINQFYRGLDWAQLIFTGLVVVAILTDSERWLKYQLRHYRTAAVSKQVKK